VKKKQQHDDYGEVEHRSPKRRVGYAQMWHVLTWDKNLSDGAYRLYAAILKYAQQKTKCYMTVKSLSEDLCKSESVIHRRIAELVSKGLITREQRPGTTPWTWIEEIDNIYQKEMEEYLANREKSSTPVKNDTTPCQK